VPTYQYACTACGHQLEAVQSFADEPLSECPVCEGRLRKLFSSVGIVFKGSGFYRTDSRSGSGTTASEPARSGDSAKSEAKSTDSAKSTDAAKPAKSESSAPAKSSTPAASTAS
jgi:putative FmdB family regulatory protein